MGLADLLFQDVVWTLISLDTETEIIGQFPPTNLVENVSGVWASEGTLGLEQPILQFIRGAQETISLDVKVWAKHQGLLGTGSGADDLTEPGSAGLLGGGQPGRASVDDIRNLARANPDLGRPEVWVFSVGEQFSQQVVVQSVGGIRYDRMRPKDGTLRGVLFRLSMMRYVEYNLDTVIGASESLVVPAKEGDYYEIIANRVYGDAILGEALRRRNPDMRDLAVGDRVHVPQARTLRGELKLVPQSTPLTSGTAQRTNLINTLEIHGEDVPTFVALENI